ncbi:hypothetical protein B0T24DRAFT_721519 [Lasiosphaeria ovina]|uniref:Myb-like domain-containing protein n=1 Tax=Lasiosphaeria ovina TaxID=92902 RepID=A0AAE0N5V4_9PEZI|nr:hypothetical protein B0T24DRAFT_721519 [Lasiosphaeria ovina]
MPPKKSAAATSESADGPAVPTLKGKVPTEGDTKFIFALLENFSTKPDFDWEKIAVILGLKDTKCTKERWRQIRLKYDIDVPETAGAAATPSRAKKTPATPATAAASGDVGGDAVMEPFTPTPKKRRAPAAKKAAPKSASTVVSEDELGGKATPKSAAKKRGSEDGENNDAQSPPKKKPTPRKRAPAKKAAAPTSASVAEETAKLKLEAGGKEEEPHVKEEQSAEAADKDGDVDMKNDGAKEDSPLSDAPDGI